MNKKMLSMITALTIAAGAFGTAGARTLPANQGTARVGSTASQFDYDFTAGAVTGTDIPGGSTADWEIGLVLDTFGNQSVAITSRATSAVGEPRWRLACNNATNTAFTASAAFFIPVSGTYVLGQRSATAPTGGVCFIDAILNSGASINRVSYNP